MSQPEIVVAVTGASGAILALRTLEVLKQLGASVHLILSEAGRLTLHEELGLASRDLEKLATWVHSTRNFGAPIASGSHRHNGMLVVPCSVKTLSAVANSYSSDLITRAADVCLKEGMPLLLALRETPLHAGHLRLMEQAARLGAVIHPPLPAFYLKPKSIDEMVDQMVQRMLDRIGILTPGMRRWTGFEMSE